jgi:hypothetical protein
MEQISIFALSLDTNEPLASLAGQVWEDV